MVAYPGVSPAFAPTGITGATAASRYVGGTASGHPVTGTFSLGDFVIDETGHSWICTVAGSPGTWVEVGSLLTSVLTANAGVSTAGSAPILTAVAGTNGGGGVQLSDHARDYMVYLQIGTAGTAMIVSMGHTSSANDVTLHASGTATSGDLYSFRLPAGWWFLWSATTATLAQSVAVGC